VTAAKGQTHRADLFTKLLTTIDGSEAS